MMSKQSARKSVIQIHDEMLKAFSNNGLNTNTFNSGCKVNVDNYDADSLNEVVIEELDTTNINVIDGDVISGSSSDQDLRDQQQRKTSSDSNFVSDFSSSEDEVDFDSLEVSVIVENVNEAPVLELLDLAPALSDAEESTSDSQNITPPRQRRKKTLKRRKRRHDILFSNSELAGVQVPEAPTNLRNRSRSECIRHEDNSDSSCSSSDQGYDSYGRRDQFYSDVPYLISSQPSRSTTSTELRRSFSLPRGFKPGSQARSRVKLASHAPSGVNLGSQAPSSANPGFQLPPGFKSKPSVTTAYKPESKQPRIAQTSSTNLTDTNIKVTEERISNSNDADVNLIMKMTDTSDDWNSHANNINSSTINPSLGVNSVRNSNHYSVIDLASLSFNSQKFDQHHDDLLSNLRSIPPSTQSPVVVSSKCTVSPLKCVTSEEFIPYVSPLSPYAFTQPVARHKSKAVGKRSCVMLSFLMGGFGLTLLIIALGYLTPVMKSGIPVY